MLDDSISLSENNRGLSKNRGLGNLNRGLFDMSVKKTMLKIFKRDDLYDYNTIDEKKEEKKYTDVSIDEQEKKSIKSELSPKLVSSSSSKSSDKNENLYIGSDVMGAYSVYKDKFAKFGGEEEFQKLIKINANNEPYIKTSMIENYLKIKNDKKKNQKSK